jgi:AraC-like DNA-binding protein
MFVLSSILLRVGAGHPSWTSARRLHYAQQQIDLGRKERVRQAVRRHLRTPTLGSKNLGRCVGMSRSNPYRLFEDTGGVARYIQRERLLEAGAVRSDTSTTRSISAIAEDLCFADASSFSRPSKENSATPQVRRDIHIVRDGTRCDPKIRVPSRGPVRQAAARVGASRSRLAHCQWLEFAPACLARQSSWSWCC